MALYSSYTLAALVAELRERAVAGEPQDTLIGWLASLVRGLGIKMRTDKYTAPQCFDLGGLPPKSRGRQVPVVIERGMLRDTEPGRIILSRSRRGGGSGLCAGVQRGRDRLQGLDAPRGAAARLRSAFIKKRTHQRVCRSRCRRCHQDWPLQCDPGTRRNSRDLI